MPPFWGHPLGDHALTTRHDNVMRKIRSLAENGKIRMPGKAPKEGNSTPFLFKPGRGKKDSILLVTQLAPSTTVELIKRWDELEAEVARQATLELSRPVEEPVVAQGVAITELKSRVQHSSTPAVSHGPLLLSSSVQYTPTMSSMEIAELTGKQHRNVVRDIRVVLEGLKLDPLKFESNYTDSLKRNQVCYNLPRDITETVITGYSVGLRHKVVVRLRELEDQVAKPIANLNDPSALRGLLLGYTEQVMKLEHKIEVDKPKVEFYDDFADSGELKSVEQLAKSVGTGRNRLFAYLRKHKILIGGNGDTKNMPFQQYIDSGRIQVKWNNHKVEETGEVKLRPRPLFTGKGATWLHKFIEQNGREGL